MALAYGNFHELSHQLRFLMFEMGLGLSQRAMEHVIMQAHHECLQRLQTSALTEHLIVNPISSHHVHDFLDQLQTQLKKSNPGTIFYRWKSLRVELDETIANEAMTIAYRQRWQHDLSRRANGFLSFWDWLKVNYCAEQMLPFLEQWGCIDHPYHPDFRAKVGFTRREVLQYSPEFQAQVRLHWCALRREQATTTQVSESYDKLIEKNFPNEYLLWRKSLLFKQVNPEDYYPIPVHPWQWRNRLQNSLSSLIDKKDLVLVPHHQITHPSMSFHTMMASTPLACHIKLATAIHNGPVISRWLSKRLQQHNNYQNRLYLASDLAGLHLSSPQSEQKQLALILCENPLVVLGDNQYLVPLAALFANSPLSNKALLLDIINSTKLSIENYFKIYCECVIDSQLHLLLRYGVALEAHQQNTLILFQDEIPKALVIKESGGILLCNNDVYQDASTPALHPESNIVTNSLAAICNKFIHGNLQSNLACWISCLSNYYALTPSALWQIVFNTINQALNTLTPEIDAAILKTQRASLLATPWQHKSSLSMRLFAEQNGDNFCTVTNPLSQF